MEEGRSNDVVYTHYETVHLCLDLVESRMKKIIENKPINVMDSSAGSNAWILEMKRRQWNLNIVKAYDISTSCPFNIKRKSFLDVHNKKNIPIDLMGFNPPFGKNNKLIYQFIQHFEILAPSYIALICKSDFAIPLQHYKVLENINLDNAFCLPFKENERIHIFFCRFLLLERTEEKVPPIPFSRFVNRTIRPIPRKIKEWSYCPQIGIRRLGLSCGKEVFWTLKGKWFKLNKKFLLTSFNGCPPLSTHTIWRWKLEKEIDEEQARKVLGEFMKIRFYGLNLRSEIISSVLQRFSFLLFIK